MMSTPIETKARLPVDGHPQAVHIAALPQDVMQQVFSSIDLKQR
jgi:hypothetical protein